MKNYIDTIKTNVLENVTVASKIKNRFYYGQLATIKDTIFPCANFDNSGGRLIEKITDYQNFSFRLWSWSGKNQTEALDVYNAIFDVLHNTVICDDLEETRIIGWETTRPIYNVDESEDEVLYYFMGRWTATMVKYQS